MAGMAVDAVSAALIVRLKLPVAVAPVVVKPKLVLVSTLLDLLEASELIDERGKVRIAEKPAVDALRATLLDYKDRMHSNEPVHLWD